MLFRASTNLDGDTSETPRQRPWGGTSVPPHLDSQYLTARKARAMPGLLGGSV